MKKITYFMFMILGMVLMVGNVNADVTYTTDPDWDVANMENGGNCKNWDQEIIDTDARQEFSFDESTGIFTVYGKNLNETKNDSMSFSYFTVKDNGKTLVAYTRNWNVALSILDGELPADKFVKTPAIKCEENEQGVKMWKTSHIDSKSVNPDDDDDPSDEPSDDDPISDPDDDSTNGGSKTTKKTKTYTTNGGTQQTTNNPNTGISPFLSLPAILGGGIAIVLRKKRIFG